MLLSCMGTSLLPNIWHCSTLAMRNCRLYSSLLLQLACMTTYVCCVVQHAMPKFTILYLFISTVILYGCCICVYYFSLVMRSHGPNVTITYFLWAIYFCDYKIASVSHQLSTTTYYRPLHHTNY